MIIRLTRLPDINTDRQLQQTPYWAYGRFAILLDGAFWFGDLHSSHPAVTRTGWYYAMDRAGTLLVSARGAGVDGEALFGKYKPVLARLVKELVKRRVIKKPESITLEK
jgi:hypothetical protein